MSMGKCTGIFGSETFFKCCGIVFVLSHIHFVHIMSLKMKFLIKLTQTIKQTS